MIQQYWSAVAIAACTTLSMASCAGPSEPVDSDDPAPAASEGSAADTAPAAEAEAMPDGLAADASVAEVAEHMLTARRSGRSTRVLAQQFPDLSRERAYEIQRQELVEQGEDAQVGWKIGWSRVLDPRTPVDPVFGYVLRSDVFESGDPVAADRFVNGSTGVEAEVAIWIDRDLPGPSHTREDVEAAVGKVAPAIEFVSSRVPSPHPHEHAIVDNVYHAGVVLGGAVDMSSVDFSTERGRITINGEEKAQGTTRSIMGRDPLEAVLWLANELPKYGRQLSAGQFVVTGTVLTPPPAVAGDHATVTFSTLGSVEIDIAP